MQETDIYIEKTDGTQRQISWIELNQIKKDILWIFDQNGKELSNAFVPEYSFNLPYWEYTTLTGTYDQKPFYQEGTLIIILCMLIEYIDIPGGNQLVFGNTELQSIIVYIKQFNAESPNQTLLKELIILGFSIAASVTKEDIARNEYFTHLKLEEFYSKLPWVSNTFIQAYYKSQIEYI
ncbi:hypothetical protein [Hymenobacter sp. DG25A]|uniref:hypothetical protein n=1 Tax=Hymenobacter sp. DG25A TaxID=1385663 RepID=UPI000AB2AE01|nr:hypothetical protein [Hymenobacter sp. DG25A]